MGDNDRDTGSPTDAVTLTAEVERCWPNSFGRAFAPVDAADCALGLEMEPIPLHAAMFGGDCEGLFLVVNGIVAVTTDRAGVRRMVDHDCDRPSPGDDITREAFDAMDREGNHG